MGFGPMFESPTIHSGCGRRYIPAYGTYRHVDPSRSARDKLVSTVTAEAWNLVALTVSIAGTAIGVVASYWFSRKKPSKKSLLYEVVANVGIDSDGHVIPDMRKWFDRRRCRLAIIGIKNDGTETIMPEEYLRDVVICFGHGAVVRSARVVHASPPNINPIKHMDGPR